MSRPEHISADDFGSAAFAVPESEPGLLRAWMERVARRWAWIAIGAAACMVVACIYLAVATPQYHVVSRLTAELPASAPPGLSHEFLAAQSEQFRSPDVSRAAADAAGLTSMKIFAGARDPYESLRRSVQADIDSDSDILEISIDTPYRDDAAKLVNAVVDAHLKRASAQTSSAAQALAELTKLREQREAERASAEKALLAFAQANPNFSAAATTRDTGVAERITQLEQTLAAAQADVAKAKSAVDTAAAAAADPAKMKQLVDGARGNGVFDAVEQQRKDAEAELAQLEVTAAKQKATMLPQHPVVLRTQAQIERLKTKLAAMDQEYANAYRAHLDNQLQSATKKHAELTALLDQQRQAAGGTDAKAAEHAKLAAALKQATDALAATDAKLKEAAVPAASSGMRLRVLEPAEPPDAPARPRKLEVLAGSLIAGLLIGLALASVRSR